MNFPVSLLRLICLFTILSLSKPGSAQSDPLKKAVKLYMNYHYVYERSEQMLSSFREEYTTSQSGINFISPAIQLTNIKSDFHEFELSNLYIQSKDNQTTAHIDSSGVSNTISGAITRSFAISFRYEYNYSILRSQKSEKLRPFIGLSLNPYFSVYSFNPHVSNSFPTRITMLGNQFMIIPRIQYKLNDIWYLDMNIPVTVLDIEHSRNKIDNPAFSLAQQRNSSSSSEWFPKQLQFRLGFGLYL